jgi:hypothetical protein
LAWRYKTSEARLREQYGHPNQQIQPAIGQIISFLAPDSRENRGTIATANHGGLLQLSAAHQTNPWAVSLLNEIVSPYQPLLYRAIFIPGATDTLKQLPPGLSSLEVSRMPALPGQALAIRGQTQRGEPVVARFMDRELVVSSHDSRFVALGGTGAFLEPGRYSLDIAVANEPLWSQPWLVEAGQWTFEEITYTGQAATIDVETIRLERERLFGIWRQANGPPIWSGAFNLPIQSYLGISSFYGARRSYAGGPYDRYHEGLDFSAYSGTPVFAPARGVVALAEQLAARGGAVIIDHGAGVYSGYYHLSEVLAQPGQEIEPGQLIGRVGSTGLSTGNHLHWDFLVNGTWVDPAAWLDSDLACWILEGLGRACESA